MHLLAIISAAPQPDQASGDLRFFTLPPLLAQECTHKQLFCTTNADGTNLLRRNQVFAPIFAQAPFGSINADRGADGRP